MTTTTTATATTTAATTTATVATATVATTTVTTATATTATVTVTVTTATTTTTAVTTTTTTTTATTTATATAAATVATATVTTATTTTATATTATTEPRSEKQRRSPICYNVKIIFQLCKCYGTVFLKMTFTFSDRDGNYTEWSDWSDCSVTCGGGVQTRSRNCTNPPPRGRGKNCDSLGPTKGTQKCSEWPCGESLVPLKIKLFLFNSFWRLISERSQIYIATLHYNCAAIFGNACRRVPKFNIRRKKEQFHSKSRHH